MPWLRRAHLTRLLTELAPGILLRLDPGACRLDRRELGRLGEALAARSLIACGWRLVGRRLRTPAGELDLLARRGDQLAVIEVKTGRLPLRPVVLPGAIGFLPDRRRDPARSLGESQAVRLHQAAGLLARRHGLACTVLLVEVRLLPGGSHEISEPRGVPAPGVRTYTEAP